MGKKYYEENKEKLKEYSRNYKQQHKDEVAAYQKRYTMTHDRTEYYKRRYREKNGDIDNAEIENHVEQIAGSQGRVDMGYICELSRKNCMTVSNKQCCMDCERYDFCNAPVKCENDKRTCGCYYNFKPQRIRKKKTQEDL